MGFPSLSEMQDRLTEAESKIERLEAAMAEVAKVIFMPEPEQFVVGQPVKVPDNDG